MISWIASALTFIGNWVLIKHKPWWVFFIFGVGNVLWAYHWWQLREWAALTLVIFFLVQNVWGIVSWRKEAG